MIASAATGTPTRHDIDALRKAATAALTGRQRGRDRKVRRDSYDKDDPRAQVWRPIGGGTKSGGGVWRSALLKTAREFDAVHREKGQRGPLTPYGLRVLEALLSQGLDFKTGRSEPAIVTLQKWTGFARATVVRALARLRAHGFLDWVRRSVPTGNDGAYGPQRAQTSNAYFFDQTSMKASVRQRFRDLVARCLRGLAPADAPPPTKPPAPTIHPDPEVAAILERLGAGIAAKEAGASS